MNTWKQIPILAAVSGFALVGPVPGQTYTNIFSFAPIYTLGATNSDGGHPQAGLFLSGNTLYGTANQGGSSGNGTVFRVNTDGTGFTNLHSFGGIDNSSGTNQDGINPRAGLVLIGDTLFGTASRGGYAGYGTLFAISTDGTTFRCLHHFSASSTNDGAYPHAPLAVSSNYLFGTTTAAGDFGMGTVFAINPNGIGFTNIHSFSRAFGQRSYTNGEGANPEGGLVVVDNVLYGTATRGGFFSGGSVFRLNTDGTGFTNLHNFSSGGYSTNYNGTNSDGFFPSAGLAVSGEMLYGTTESSGFFGAGTIFGIETDGTGFTNLHNFVATESTNGEGGFSVAALALAGHVLYGTGQSGGGTVFSLRTDGTGFTNLWNFVPAHGGGFNPYAGLTLGDNVLFGAANDGGQWASGAVFRLTLPEPSSPQLALTVSGPNAILTWPADAAVFTLQSATNLDSAMVWSAVLATQFTANGLTTVTNPISANQEFYRLSR